MESSAEHIVTTIWVLAELGNYLSNGRQRRLFAPFVQELRRERLILIIPLEAEQFERGLRTDDAATIQTCSPGSDEREVFHEPARRATPGQQRCAMPLRCASSGKS